MKMSEMPIPTTNPDPTVSNRRTVFIMINLPLGTPMLVLMYVEKKDSFSTVFFSKHVYVGIGFSVGGNWTHPKNIAWVSNRIMF